MDEFTTTSSRGIDNDEPYIYWRSKFDEVILDGVFTVAQLRAIADHMERHSGGPT